MIVGPGEFVTEPFEFGEGGVVCVQAAPAIAQARTIVEFRIEGSQDKTHWTDLLAGAASAGELLEVACRDRVAPWGRVRVRSSGPEVSVSVLRIPGEARRRTRSAKPASASGRPIRTRVRRSRTRKYRA